MSTDFDDLSDNFSAQHPVFMFGWNLCKALYTRPENINQITRLGSFYRMTYYDENIGYNHTGQQYVYPVPVRNPMITAFKLPADRVVSYPDKISVIEIYYKIVTDEKEVRFDDETFIFIVDKTAVDEFHNRNSFYEFINSRLKTLASLHISGDNPKYLCQAEYRMDVDIALLKRALKQKELYLIEAIDQIRGVSGSSTDPKKAEQKKPIVQRVVTFVKETASDWKMVLTILFFLFLFILMIHLIRRASNQSNDGNEQVTYVPSQPSVMMQRPAMPTGYPPQYTAPNYGSFGTT
jgi:hypothetical protein